MGCNQSKHVVRGAIAFEDDDDHDEALLVRRRSRAKNVHLDVAQAPHGQEKALKLPLRLRDGNSTSSGSNNSSRNNVKSPSHGASRTPAMTPHGDDDSNEVTPPPNRSPILNLILRSQSHPNGSSRSTSEDGPSLHPSASMMHQDTRHIPGSYASAVMSSMGDQNLANGKSSDVVAGGEGLDASLGGDVGAAVSKSMSAVLDSMTGRGPGTERKSSGAGLLAGDIGFKGDQGRVSSNVYVPGCSSVWVTCLVPLSWNPDAHLSLGNPPHKHQQAAVVFAQPQAPQIFSEAVGKSFDKSRAPCIFFVKLESNKVPRTFCHE